LEESSKVLSVGRKGDDGGARCYYYKGRRAWEGRKREAFYTLLVRSPQGEKTDRDKLLALYEKRGIVRRRVTASQQITENSQ